jgi:hypothetical protein
MITAIGLLAGARAEVRRHLDAVAAGAGARVVDVPVEELWQEDPGGAPAPRVVVVDGCAPVDPARRWELGEPVPRGPRLTDRREVVVAHVAGEAPRARQVADQVGSAWVAELPEGAPWLVARAGRQPEGRVLAVVGAVGGAGASTVALACAAAAGSGCLLVDADPWSAGLDLPLGIPGSSAGRWGSVPDTEEPLVAESLTAALPRVQGITVVTGEMPEPAGGRVARVVEVGRAGFLRTVVDCGRSPAHVPLGPSDALVLVLPATLAGVVAARRVLDDAVVGRVVLVLRAIGWLPIDEVADRLGVAIALELPRMRRLGESIECGEALSGRMGRDLARVGDRIWAAAS